MRYVIAYDVGSARRRQRVADLLASFGRRVQESVFECTLDEQELARVTVRLERVLDPHADRCHLYRLCASCAAASRRYGHDLEAAPGPVLVV